LNVPADPSLAFPPRCAARYRQDRLIGSGAHGAVFRATQIGLERTVAVKILHPDMAREGEQVERFRIEAQSTASIVHPNVVVVLDFDLDDALPWIAYEYLDGPTLHQVVAKGPMDWQRALLAVVHVAGALEASHAHGILHRDVKPSNVIEAGQDVFKLTDFGLARLTARLESFTQEGCVVGTPAYLAPEVLEGQGHTTLSDIFATGAMLYKLVVGQVPPRPDLRAGGGEGAPGLPAPSLSVPGLPPVVDEIVARCTRRSPTERYQSAIDLRRAAQRARTPAEAPHATPRLSRPGRSRPTVAARARSRSRGRRRALFVAALLAAALALPLALSRRAPQADTSPSSSPAPAKASTAAGPVVPPLPDAEKFRQTVTRMRTRWEKQSDITQLLNPLNPNYEEAARQCAQRAQELRGDLDAMARVAETLAGGAEPALLPDHVLHWLVRASGAHFCAWAQLEIYEELEKNAREIIAKGQDIPGRHELLDGMDDLEYDREGVPLLRRYLGAALELFSRMARTPERAGPDSMEVVFEQREIARMRGHCRWPKGDDQVVARASLEFKARLARLPAPAGTVLGRLLTRFWDWGDRTSRVRMTRASYVESIADLDALGGLMPGASSSLRSLSELMRREMEGYTGPEAGSEPKR
jgi:serine/threonine protein kinase